MSFRLLICLPIHFLFGAEGAAISSNIHCDAALHRIIASMQSNAQSTSCYYLSLVTQGYAVCGLTGFLVA